MKMLSNRHIADHYNLLRKLVLALQLLSAPLAADTIYFKDGKKLEGEIISQTLNVVVIKTEDGLTREFEKNKIKRMVYETSAMRNERKKHEAEVLKKQKLEREAAQDRQWNLAIQNLNAKRKELLDQAEILQYKVSLEIETVKKKKAAFADTKVDSQKMDEKLALTETSTQDLSDFLGKIETDEAQPRFTKPQRIYLLNQNNITLANKMKALDVLQEQLTTAGNEYSSQSLAVQKQIAADKDISEKFKAQREVIDHLKDVLRQELSNLKSQIDKAQKQIQANPDAEDQNGPLHQVLKDSQKTLQHVDDQLNDLNNRRLELVQQKPTAANLAELKIWEDQNFPNMTQTTSNQNKKLTQALQSFSERMAENRKPTFISMPIGFWSSPLGQTLNPLDSYSGNISKNPLLRNSFMFSKMVALGYWLDWQSAKIYTYQRNAFNPYLYGATGIAFPGLSEDSKIVLGLSGLTAYQEEQSPVMHELLGQSRKRAERYLARQRKTSGAMTLLVFAADYGLGRYLNGRSSAASELDSERPQFWVSVGQGQVQAGIVLHL